MDYTITNIQKRDEWTFQGNHMQDYAITLTGEDNKGWIKLTQKFETRPPQVGDPLHGHIEKKTTKNGNEYWKFKKVNPNFENRGGGNSSGAGSSIKQEDIDYLILMMEEMTLRRPAPDNPQPRSANPETPVGGGKEQYDDPFEGLI